MNELDTRFHTLVEKCLEGGLPATGMDSRLADLDIDSLALLDFVLALESEFFIEIDVDAVTEDMTLSQIRDMLEAAREDEQ